MTLVRLLTVHFFKVVLPINITKASKSCRIFLFDKNLYDDDDFLPSSVIDCQSPDYAPHEERSTYLLQKVLI